MHQHPGLGQLILDGRHESTTQLLELKAEFRGPRILGQEDKDVGELDDILVGEVFLDHGLVAGARQEQRPGAVAGWVGELERDLAVQASPGDAPRPVIEALPGEGEIGQPGLPQQSRALVNKVVEVHGGGSLGPSAGWASGLVDVAVNELHGWIVPEPESALS